jgi:hypothetical protein
MNPNIFRHSEIFLNRIRKYGKRASFPEFKGTVSFLIGELYQSEASVSTCKKNPAMQSWRQIIQHSLIGVTMLAEGRPRYPYQDTIYVIEQCLQFIDVVQRQLNPDRMSFPNNI